MVKNHARGVFCMPKIIHRGKKERRIIMKDRSEPCIYYICKDADCEKGFVKVNLKKCKNCPKYQPRKTKKIKESFKAKKQKDKDRHDKWN